MAFRFVVNNLILEEIEDIANINRLVIERRLIRDTSNPLELPEKYFKSLFRFTKDMFRDMVDILSNYLPNTRRCHAISKQFKILTALNFYAHGSYQKNIGNDFSLGLSQPAVSQCIEEVTNALQRVVNDYVKFPTTHDDIRKVKGQFLEKFNVGGIIGVIDGTHIALIAPPTTDEDNPPVEYFNRKGFYSINVQIICDVNLKILSANARFPGARHDSAIWASSNIRRFLHARYDQNQENNWLLGDSGYPLEPWLLTPIIDAAPGTREARYTDLHIRIRNTVERCIGVLKMRFRCLTKTRALMFRPVKAAKVINACVVLHNLATIYRLENDDLSEDEDEDDDDDDDPFIFQGGDNVLQNILREGRRSRENFIRLNVN